MLSHGQARWRLRKEYLPLYRELVALPKREAHDICADNSDENEEENRGYKEQLRHGDVLRYLGLVTRGCLTRRLSCEHKHYARCHCATTTLRRRGEPEMRARSGVPDM